MTIKAKILAEDFRTTNYTNGGDCVITRALNRAGYDGWKDFGLGIKDGDGKVITDYNEQYSRLSNKVIAMYGLFQDYEKREGYYREPIEPADFEFEIEY